MLLHPLVDLHVVTPFWPIFMLLHPLADLHVLTPFGRFTFCYTLLADLHAVTPFWPICMLYNCSDSFALHAVTLFYDKLAYLHTATPSATIRPKYMLIHLLLFFLLASFYTSSPPS
jgi:hypothetical protein